MRVEHEQNPAIVLACKFPNHERAGPRGGLPMHVAHAVVRQVVSEGVKIVAAALVVAFQRSLERRQNLKEIARWLDRRIDKRFGAELNAARLLQKAERETRDDAKHVLAVGAASWKCNRDVLLDAVALRQVGKIYRRFEQRRGERLLIFRPFHAQRK